MSSRKTAESLRNTVLTRLLLVARSQDTNVVANDTFVIASVPEARQHQAMQILTSLTALPLESKGGRSRFAVFTAPEDTEPYSRVVYFRAKGPGVPARYVGKELRQGVRIVPGDSTEADIPKALATLLFCTPERANDITVTRVS